MTKPDRFVIPAALTVVLVHMALAVSAVRDASNTVDELLHIAGGTTYWLLDDYRLQPENGNLPQRWHTIPLAFGRQPRLPSCDGEAWRLSRAMDYGREMLFDLGNDPDMLLWRCRLFAVVLSGLLVAAVFAWARDTFGTAGGLTAIVLAATSPSLLAHGPLANSDVCAALFFALAAWRLWALLHQVTPLRIVAAGGIIGGLFLSKFSAPLIVPIAMVMTAVATAVGRPMAVRVPGWTRNVTRSGPRLAVTGLVALVIAGITFVLVWAAHDFRFEAAHPTQRPQFFEMPPGMVGKALTFDDLCVACGGPGAVIQACWRGRVLPQAWLYGLLFVLCESRERPAFLLGDHSMIGWPSYFPICFAIKNPLVHLAVFGAGISALLVRRRSAGSAAENPPSFFSGRHPTWPTWYAATPAWATLVVLWPACLVSHLNIGERHLLPSYPAMWVIAGAAATLVSQGRCSRQVLAASLLTLALAWSVTLAAWTYPTYLAYFNPIVPRGRAHEWLVDSNLDWGQDVIRLKAWLERHKRADEPAYFYYFGSAQVAAYDLPAEGLYGDPASGELVAWQPGLYCVSATRLQTVYGRFPGSWNVAYERRYRELLAKAEADETDLVQAVAHRLSTEEIADLRALRVNRLLALLRVRSPDAHVGRSILIYRLSAADLATATTGRPVQLDPVSWPEREDARRAGRGPAQ